MESDSSEVDELADLDFATFAQPGHDHTTVGTGQASENVEGHSDAWYNDKDSEDSGLGEKQMNSEIIASNPEPFFSLDPGFDFDSYVINNRNNTSQNSNPFPVDEPRETNPFHTGFQSDQIVSPTNPFTSDMMYSNGIYNPFYSENVALDSSLSVLTPEPAEKNPSTDKSGATNLHELKANPVTSKREYVYLNRLPGENLGMVLGIEGDQNNRQPIEAVLVKSVTPGGAAARACEGGNKILVGDVIQEIDGRPLTELTHDECISLFQEMPDNVVLTIYRQEGLSPEPTARKRKAPPIPPPRKHFEQDRDATSIADPTAELYDSTIGFQSEGSTAQEDYNETQVPVGFLKLDVTIFRKEGDSLGLSIVPSYGATCDLYQIKRLLESGACAQSGRLEVGDRLLCCDGLSLKGLTQAQCLNVLKSSGKVVELTVLRQAEGHVPDTTEETSSEVKHIEADSGIGGYSLEPEGATESSISKGVHVSEIFVESDVNGLNEIGYENNLLDGDRKERKGFLEDLEQDALYGLPENEASPQIPPPAQFSDLKETEELEFQVNETSASASDCITNIDDILFGLNGDTNIGESETHFKAPKTNQDSLLISFDADSFHKDSNVSVNDSQSDFLDGAFDGKSLEEFAEECFNSIGNENNSEENHNREQGGLSITEGSIESVSEPAESLLDLDTDPSLDAEKKIKDKVTLIPVTNTNSSPKFVTKIPITRVPSGDEFNTSDTVSTQASSKPQSYATTISVNSPHQQNITQIDIAGTEESKKNLSPPPSKRDSDGRGSVVFYSHAGNSPSSIVSTTIKVDGLSKQKNVMSDKPNNSVVHTTLGVSTKGQTGDDEEMIQPMTAAKDSQGKPLCVLSELPSSSKPLQHRVLDDEAKRDIANVLAAFSVPSVKKSDTVSNGNDDTASEQEIVPTLLSRDHKEVVLNVLQSWSSSDSNKKPTMFQKAVSDLLDSRNDAEELISPNQTKPTNAVNKEISPVQANFTNAMVHTTLGILNKGKEDDVVRPMAVAKDHQGKYFCVPSDKPEGKRPDEHRKIDDNAKTDIAAILASISTPRIQSKKSSKELNVSEGEATEQEIVPTVLSRDQKDVVMNVLNKWVSADTSKKPSVFQRAIAGVIGSNKEEDHSEDENEGSAAEVHNSNPEPKGVEEDSLQVTTTTSVESKPAKPVEVDIVQKTSVISVESEPKKVLNKVSVFEKAAIDSAQTLVSDQVVTRPKPKATEFHSAVNMFEKTAHDSSPNPITEPVVLRPKNKQSLGFKAKIDSFQTAEDSPSAAVSSRRPRSMIEVTSSSNTSSTQPKFDDIRKSFTTENRAPPALRPLSAALRPLSASTNRLSMGNYGRSAIGNFSGSSFTSRVHKTEYPKTRQEKSPFQVDILKGIVGLGLKFKVTPEGYVKVTEIQRGGPVDKNGNVRVGDYLLYVNSAQLTGQTDAKVQQVMRLLPRGLAKLVVSATAPDSDQEPQHHTSDGSHYPLRVSPKPFAVENRETPSPSTTRTFIATEDGIEPYTQQTQEVNSSGDLTLPIFTTAESTVSSSQSPVTARIEIRSSGQQGGAPVKIAIKPTPTPRPGQEVHRPKALPRHAYASSTNESWETSSDDSTPRELRDSLISHSKNTSGEVASSQGRPMGRETGLSQSRVSAFQSSRAMFEQKTPSRVLPSVPSRPKPLPAETSEIATVGNNISTQESPSVSNEDKDSPSKSHLPAPLCAEKENEVQPPASEMIDVEQEKIEVKAPKPAMKEEGLGVKPEDPTVIEAKPVSKGSPKQKVPPPVAPKPRLNSSSSTKSDGSVEEPVQVKPTPKISSGYERLQAITKASKPSKVIEKSRTFVTSTAKMFDNKPTESYSEPSVSQRRVSLGIVAQSDSSKIINKSLMPLNERRKSTGASLSSNPMALSQPASLSSTTLSRPNSLNTTATKPKDITIPGSPSSDSDSSKTKAVLSPTRLNSALSPRQRSSSTNSPTSPPFSFASKQAPKVKDQSPTKSSDGKTSIAQDVPGHTGIFKSTPITVVNPKSLSQTSPLHTKSQSPHQDTILGQERRGRSYTAPPIQSRSSSVSSQISEEVLEDNMKKFDDLLMDTPHTGTETDPNDLALWAPVRKDGPPSVASPKPVVSQRNVHSKTDEIKKPVASPRKKPEIKDNETKPEGASKEENNKEKAKKEKETVSEVSNTIQAQSIENLLSRPTESDHSENIVAANMAEEVLNANQKPDDDKQAEKISANYEIKTETTHSFQVDTKTSNQISDDIEELQKPTNSVINNFASSAEVVQNGLKQSGIKEKEESALELAIDKGEEKAIKNRTNNEQDQLSRNDDKNEKQHGDNADDDEMYKNQAIQIVENVMAKVAREPMISTNGKKVDNAEEAQTSSDDEPPPLPGAPPPPLILRDTTLLVKDSAWLDQKDPPDVTDGIKNEMAMEHPTDLPQTSVMISDQTDVTKGQTKKNQEDQILENQLEAMDDDYNSRADSAEPLNSTGDSLRDGDMLRVNSPSPVDMLSEDSGMPADEDHEVATDDAISPPGEYAETAIGYDSKRHEQYLTQLDGDLPSSISPRQESRNVKEQSVNLIVSTGKDSKVFVEPHQPQHDMNSEGHADHPVTSIIDTLTTNEDLAPTLPPASSLPCVTTQHVNIDHNNSSFSQTSTVLIQSSDSPPLSKETTLPGDRVKPDDTSSSEQATISSESKLLQEDSENGFLNISKAELPNDQPLDETASSPDTSVDEEQISQILDTSPPTIISKRKWCLRSNKTSSPILLGDPGVPVQLNYTEKSLSNIMPVKDLVSLIDKANSVLDATSQTDLELTVVHLHREGDSVSLGIDLKHTGGSWFQVTGIKRGSLVDKEGGVKEGDWLVAVDNLWCDKVTVMRLLARLTKPKHDSLLVVVRGKKSQDIADSSSSKPAPVVTPRSAKKEVENAQVPEKTPREKLVASESQSQAGKELIRTESSNVEPMVTAVKEEKTNSVPPSLPPDGPPPVPEQQEDQDAPPLPDMGPPPVPASAPPLLPQEIDTQTAVAAAPQEPEKFPSVQSEISPRLPENRAEGTKTEAPGQVSPSKRNEIKAEAPVKTPPQTSPRNTNASVKAKLIHAQPPTHSTTTVEATSVPVSAPIEQPQAGKSSANSASTDELGPGIHTVVMMKGATGVGFCLEGGKNSPKGNLPIAIKRIFKGGPAEKCGLLKVKDVILEVNGVDFTQMAHYEAWNHLKFLDDGEVRYTIQRLS